MRMRLERRDGDGADEAASIYQETEHGGLIGRVWPEIGGKSKEGRNMMTTFTAPPCLGAFAHGAIKVPRHAGPRYLGGPRKSFTDPTIS